MNTRNIEQEISDFQAVIEAALDTRTSCLRDEIIRLTLIRDNCDEWLTRYLSWAPSHNEPSIGSSTESGKIDLSHLDKNRELDIYVFGEKMTSRRRARIMSKEQTRELYPHRKESLVILINLAKKYLSGFERYEKEHTLTQYSIYKHKDYNGNRDVNIAHPYRPDLLPPDEQANFLLQLSNTDKRLARYLLSILTHINGTPLITQYVSNNDYEGLEQALSYSDVEISEEITAWCESLNVADIKEVDGLLAASYSVQKDFFLMKFVEPLDNLWEEMQAISYKEWPDIVNDVIPGSDATSNETTIEEKQSQIVDKTDSPLKNLDASFPGIKQKFKDEMVIDEITDYLAGHYIDDDPDVKKLFKYRITGLGELTPELCEKKIVWYMKGKHPNDLNGLLFEISSDRRSYQEYVAKFFEFASGHDENHRPIIISIHIEPLTQHKNTKIVDALKEKPNLRHLF